MANRYARSEFLRSFIADARVLALSVSFGSSGAPTIVSGTGMGIKSVARSSAGRYVITLQDAYKGLIRMSHSFVSASAPASPSMYIAAEAVSSASAPTITVVFNTAGTATDPASGEKVLLEIELNNSSQRY